MSGGWLADTIVVCTFAWIDSFFALDFLGFLTGFAMLGVVVIAVDNGVDAGCFAISFGGIVDVCGCMMDCDSTWLFGGSGTMTVVFCVAFGLVSD